MNIGLKYEQSSVVTAEQTAKILGSGTLDVFATPAMIAFIENTCMNAVKPYLNEGECTVGTLIDVKHTAASPVGISVKCECELVEVDRRRLVFNVKVSDNCGEIGTAKHERFIVNAEKFINKTNQKLK